MSVWPFTQQLTRIEKKVDKIMIDQKTFDTDLAALTTAITNLIAAVDKLIAATPAADLTAEDQAVQTAAASVQAELTKITPPAPTKPAA